MPPDRQPDRGRRIRLNYRISNSTAVGSLASFTVRTIPSKPTQTPSTMNTHRIGGRPMALQSCSKRASRLDMRGVLFGASFGHAGCTQRPGSSPSPQVGRREELRLWRLHQLVCGLYVGRRSRHELGDRVADRHHAPNRRGSDGRFSWRYQTEEFSGNGVREP
jgi:hypothetical protein